MSHNEIEYNTYVRYISNGSASLKLGMNTMFSLNNFYNLIST